MIVTKNENDRTAQLCIPGAIAVTRRRCPTTRATKSSEIVPRGRSHFMPAGFIEPGVTVVVCSTNFNIDNLIEVIIPTGETRFVMTKFLRFNQLNKETK